MSSLKNLGHRMKDGRHDEEFCWCRYVDPKPIDSPPNQERHLGADVPSFVPLDPPINLEVRDGKLARASDHPIDHECETTHDGTFCIYCAEPIMEGQHYHNVFLKDGTNYVCQCRTRTKDHSWRSDTLDLPEAPKDPLKESQNVNTSTEHVNPVNVSDQGLREQLAAIEHERWADWQRYLHSKLKRHNGVGGQCKPGMLMSPEDYQHWEEQIAAHYSELTEREKDSDREQVDRYWPLIEQFINTQANKLLDKLLEQKRKLLDIDTDSLVVTDRGKEHPFIEAVPVEAIEALRSSR